MDRWPIEERRSEDKDTRAAVVTRIGRVRPCEKSADPAKNERFRWGAVQSIQINRTLTRSDKPLDTMLRTETKRPNANGQMEIVHASFDLITAHHLVPSINVYVSLPPTKPPWIICTKGAHTKAIAWVCARPTR